MMKALSAAEALEEAQRLVKLRKKAVSIVEEDGELYVMDAVSAILGDWKAVETLHYVPPPLPPDPRPE